MQPYFDSYQAEYREPFGAVAVRTRIHFKLSLPREWRCRAAELSVRCDEHYNTADLSMFWCGMDGEGREFWECHFSPAQEGIYWYFFCLHTDSGVRRLGRGKNGQGTPDSDDNFQLTVYSADFATPDWLRGGIIYQIFPDRYAASKDKKEGVPSDRAFHADWYELPEWKPNAFGKITNQDYFGGDLEGVRRHLADLAKLGVTCIYFNPIFEAHSNHRYNTADYQKIDPLLGTDEDFSRLCADAAQYGIRILLDGVFSHTGSDSIYFNQNGRYASVGACQSEYSPYFLWYRFHPWPEKYECWWGFLTLPEVDESSPSFAAFIHGADGVAAQWLKKGASGWRLDVADELPDDFLESFRQCVKKTDPQALILGEVWEDASNKISYGQRRKFLLGKQLDSVMNYPFRTAILQFLQGGSGEDFLDRVGSIVENYPPQVLHNLMNPLSTHDTPRILTLLGGTPADGRSKDWQAEQKLTPEQRQRGESLLKIAAAIQYLLPGVPSIYYGDEAGLEGYGDPFNRTCYPWHRERKNLLEYYCKLGQLRKGCSSLQAGRWFAGAWGERWASFYREDEKESLFCVINCNKESISLSIPWAEEDCRIIWGVSLPGGSRQKNIPPETVTVFQKIL